MKLSLNFKTKTLMIESDVRADELLNFINRNGMWEWTIRWRKL